MKKIMFNDKYGLTEAVLNGKKTMTRRIIPIDLYNQTDWKAVTEGDFEAVADGEGDYHDIRRCGMYKEDEVVAIAQKYWDLRKDDAFYEALEKADPSFPLECIKGEKGCHNKMFVKADWMPHRIRITDVKVERLQDISDEDVYKEGFIKESVNNGWGNAAWHWEAMLTYMDYLGRYKHIRSENPKEAFSFLIDKVCGNGTWDSNPWVFAYSFELIK